MDRDRSDTLRAWRCPKTAVFVAALCAASVAALFTPAMTRGEGIVFAPSVAAARAAGGDKPVVLVFSAVWCGWCRKLSAVTLADPAVVALRDEFGWVKVDADAEPDLAARLQVRGLPHTAVLDAAGRTLASRAGYMNAEDFVAFLREARSNPAPVDAAPNELLRRLADIAAAEDPAALVREAVESLAAARSADRGTVLAALVTGPAEIDAALLDLLDDDRLAWRAAAWRVLSQRTRRSLAFDPFGSLASRRAEIAACRRELGLESAPPRSDAGPDPMTPTLMPPPSPSDQQRSLSDPPSSPPPSMRD